MELTNEFEVAVPVEQAWAVLTDVERIAPCLPGAELKEIEGDEYRGIVKVKVGPITASYKGAARFEVLDEAAHRAVLKAEGRETRGQGNASATITAAMEPSETGTKVKVSTDLAITGKVAQFGRGVLAEVSGKLLGQFVHNLETTVLGKPTEEASAAPLVTAEPTAEPAAEPVAEAAAANPTAGNGAQRARPARRGTGVIKARDAAPDPGTESKSPSPAVEPAGASPTGDDPSTVSDAGTPAAAGGEAPSAEPPRSAIRQIQSAPVEPVDLVGIAGPSLAKRLWPYASVAGVLFLARIVVYALRRRKK